MQLVVDSVAASDFQSDGLRELLQIIRRHSAGDRDGITIALDLDTSEFRMTGEMQRRPNGCLNDLGIGLPGASGSSRHVLPGRSRFSHACLFRWNRELRERKEREQMQCQMLDTPGDWPKRTACAAKSRQLSRVLLRRVC